MGKLIAELQKSVLKMRMVTIDHVFRRFGRPMRELAAQRGKQVELQTAGGETELDRALVDILYEPLLHLLRNAVDHGIETIGDRLDAGKPEAGRISMRAYHEGNQVVVEVSDDGRGIDAAAVKRKAVEAGAITKQDAERMSDEDAIELIFLQGLSTARELTQLSGRGVGAAAVKASIEQLRGTVAVRSELGGGTCFTLRMPLTLAIIKALLFTASGQLFALPLLAVSEIARAEGSDIIHLDGIENYRLRDHFVSLVRPGAVLSFDRRIGGSGAALRSEPKRLFVIVLTAGDKKYGVVADELLGEQELVIKPLDSSWVQNDALAGASVLGDGRVVLIMDCRDGVQKSSQIRTSERELSGKPMPSERKKIRVLVVDDSALMRKLISNLLAKDPELEVIATAIDGCFALTKVEQLKPDVVTLDVDMPRMDGLTALAEMVSKHKTPVIMLSSLTTRGAALTMQALEKGALDFVCKPSGTARLPEMAEELISKIKAAARTNLLTLGRPSPTGAPVRKKDSVVATRGGGQGRVIAIGASSGGPHALRHLLPRVPADIDAGIVVVQHMPESFTAMLAHWLNEICDLEVKEAESGDLALPGRVLIAPGSFHMKVRRTPAGCEVLLERGALVNGHKPSVDVLFRSVAQEYGSLATGIIMTGMGSDGAQGLGEIMGAGGHTVAQDKESCAVYGMPRVAVERGYANRILPLTEMAQYLSFKVGRLGALEESYA